MRRSSKKLPNVSDQTQAEEAIKAYLSLIGKKGGLKGISANLTKTWERMVFH
jgi:hypothetical protein